MPIGMRKLILKMSVTVDGFAAEFDGKQPWIQKTGIEDKEAAAWTMEAIRGAGAHLMGSRTFRDMASYWPYSKEIFAGPMNTIPKVVFTHAKKIDPDVIKPAPGVDATSPSSQALESWCTARIASGPLSEEVAKLKQEPGGPLIAYGGASFAQNLLRERLPDEVHLLVHPVAIGRGLPVFAAIDRAMRLEVVDVKRFPLGGVGHIYRLVDAPRS